MTNDVSTADASRLAATAFPGASAAPPRGFWRANLVTLVFGALAVALAAAVYFGTPNAKGLDSLWQLLFHLLPFVAATVAIGHLDHHWSQKLRLHLILPPLCFLVFFCYFVSHIFYYFAQNDFHTYFDNLYYTQLMLVPFIILVIALCVRLGGGRTTTVVRLAVAMLILQLSGIEDLSFRLILLVREDIPMPEVWDWADHMAVRLGSHPTAIQAYIFIGVHVLIAALVLFVPGRRRKRADGPAGGPDTSAVTGADGPTPDDASGAAVADSAAVSDSAGDGAAAEDTAAATGGRAG